MVCRSRLCAIYNERIWSVLFQQIRKEYGLLFGRISLASSVESLVAQRTGDMTVEEVAMPSLKCLKLRGCEQLKMIPDCLRRVTTLRELKVTYMPERFRTRLQANEGDDWCKIAHIPSVEF
ncbi:hypothetical protein HHK36_026111 [Tetracentron sinense]|uniref:Uncharacterized protein n=1 Tax=Tetracentron sinense TaxID=13715 RepID=A0A835D466_TETSI|nr:hypothetical protein HHK36_026111 [Tetracentron sinense]